MLPKGPSQCAEWAGLAEGWSSWTRSFGLNSTTKPNECSQIETNIEILLRYARMDWERQSLSWFGISKRCKQQQGLYHYSSSNRLRKSLPAAKWMGHKGLSSSWDIKHICSLSHRPVKKEVEYKNALIKYYHRLAHKCIITSVKSLFVKSTISELIITGIFNVSETVMLQINKDAPPLLGKTGKRDGLNCVMNSKIRCFAYVLKNKS